MKPPIHSKKHYIQRSLSTTLAGASSEFLIALAVEIPSVAEHVEEGSVLKAVFVEMWARTGDTAGGSVLMSLVKVPESGTMTFAEQIALQDYTNKKNVLYHTQGTSNDQDADAIAFVRQWFKIPKGKQRFGLGDKLSLFIAAQALDQITCGFATYKEYT